MGSIYPGALPRAELSCHFVAETTAQIYLGSTKNTKVHSNQYVINFYPDMNLTTSSFKTNPVYCHRIIIF